MLKKRYFKTVDECEVTFKIEPEEAQEVALVIESNGWEPIEMDQLKAGPFKARLRLPLNRQVQFRYLIDRSTWQNDDEADAYVPNEYGTTNSVINTARSG